MEGSARLLAISLPHSEDTPGHVGAQGPQSRKALGPLSFWRTEFTFLTPIQQPVRAPAATSSKSSLLSQLVPARPDSRLRTCPWHSRGGRGGRGRGGSLG